MKKKMRNENSLCAVLIGTCELEKSYYIRAHLHMHIQKQTTEICLYNHIQMQNDEYVKWLIQNLHLEWWNFWDKKNSQTQETSIQSAWNFGNNWKILHTWETNQQFWLKPHQIVCLLARWTVS